MTALLSLVQPLEDQPESNVVDMLEWKAEHTSPAEVRQNIQNLLDQVQAAKDYVRTLERKRFKIVQ